MSDESTPPSVDINEALCRQDSGAALEQGRACPCACSEESHPCKCAGGPSETKCSGSLTARERLTGLLRADTPDEELLAIVQNFYRLVDEACCDSPDCETEKLLWRVRYLDAAIALSTKQPCSNEVIVKRIREMSDEKKQLQLRLQRKQTELPTVHTVENVARVDAPGAPIDAPASDVDEQTRAAFVKGEGVPKSVAAQCRAVDWVALLDKAQGERDGDDWARGKKTTTVVSAGTSGRLQGMDVHDPEKQKQPFLLPPADLAVCRFRLMRLRASIDWIKKMQKERPDVGWGPGDHLGALEKEEKELSEHIKKLERAEKLENAEREAEAGDIAHSSEIKYWRSRALSAEAQREASDLVLSIFEEMGRSRQTVERLTRDLRSCVARALILHDDDGAKERCFSDDDYDQD